MKKVVESLIYIQDSGLKNVLLDRDAIYLCKPEPTISGIASDQEVNLTKGVEEYLVKILDCGIASNNSYMRLLNHL